MTDYSREVTTPLMGAQSVDPRRRRRIGSTSLQFGDYRILGMISRGGTCGVYLAAHIVTQERVALKILDPHWGKHEDIVERMFAEHSDRLRGLASRPARDPASAQRAPDGTPYLVMELLDGENLGELVERGRVVVGAIAAIGAQIADGRRRAARRRHHSLRHQARQRVPALRAWPRGLAADQGDRLRRLATRRRRTRATRSPARRPAWHPSSGAAPRRRSRTSTRSAASSTGSSPARPRSPVRCRS